MHLSKKKKKKIKNEKSERRMYLSCTHIFENNDLKKEKKKKVSQGEAEPLVT